MFNGALIGARLGQYGAVWLGAFLLTLAAALGGVLVLHTDLIRLTDAVLPIAFAGLGLGLIAFAVVTLLAREGAATKIALLVLTAFLALPLLWSPVSAVLLAAWLTHATLEYSTAYAQFRIEVSQLIYPAFRLVFAGSAAQTAWSAFQSLATLIGGTAATIQLWPMARRMFAAQR